MYTGTIYGYKNKCINNNTYILSCIKNSQLQIKELFINQFVINLTDFNINLLHVGTNDVTYYVIIHKVETDYQVENIRVMHHKYHKNDNLS